MLNDPGAKERAYMRIAGIGVPFAAVFDRKVILRYRMYKPALGFLGLARRNEVGDNTCL